MTQPLAAPYSYFADSDGNPLSGGLVYTYTAGTTTPKNAYTDSTAGTPLSNPVVLDSAGRAQIWLSGNYKVVVKDSLGNTIQTTDNITTATNTGDMTKAVYDAANIQEQFVGLTSVQTLTNKSVKDSTFTIVDDADTTKKFSFQVSGVTTATTRTMTVPDADFTVAGIATTQTLTNKTITDAIDNGYSRCTAQFDKTSDTTAAAVTGLTISLSANASYVFEAHITGTANASGGVKFAMDTPASPTSISYTAWNYNGTTLNAVSTTTSAAATVGAATAAFTNAIIKGTIVVGSNSGTLRVFFAQNASFGTASSVFVNSFLWAKRIA